MPNKNRLPEDLHTALSSIITKIDRQDESVRESQLRRARKLDLYWHGIMNIFWNESVKDYRIIGNEKEEIDTYYLDKVINIYRPHGESIIAALSQDTPQVIFTPDDAENDDDLTTAKTWSRISDLITKWNNGTFLLLNALFVLFNEGPIFTYIYSKQDEKNGMYKIPIRKEQSFYTDFYTCPYCGQELLVNTRTEGAAEQAGKMPCPNCMVEVLPMLESEEEQIPVIVGYKEEPKPRPIIENYGVSNVKVSHRVKRLEDCGYLILETEDDINHAKEIAGEELAEKLQPSADDSKYQRWARSSIDSNQDDGKSIVTVRRIWLRPWMFNELELELCKRLKKLYPNGVYALYIDDIYIESIAESMDECWRVAYNPLSKHIHYDAVGAIVAPIQEIQNEVTVLELQCMEYSIPETFADPNTLNLDKYGKMRLQPGNMTNAKAPAGKALSDGFHTLKTATFPKEADDFDRKLDEKAQFTLGSFPSVFGGTSTSGSKTLGEYEKSRAYALQRLSNTWKIISFWWAEVIECAVRTFISDMKEDVRYAAKQGQSFINVWIRRSDLTGKIGSVNPESVTGFPISSVQQRDMLTNLLGMMIPEINSVIFDPENSDNVKRLMGFPTFYVPGESDRNKQLAEINEMLQGVEVEVDPDIDNHMIEFNTGVTWLNGEFGQDCKRNNPMVYEMIKQHIMYHKQISDYQMMMQQQQQMRGEIQNEENTDTGSTDAVSKQPS